MAASSRREASASHCGEIRLDQPLGTSGVSKLRGLAGGIQSGRLCRLALDEVSPCHGLVPAGGLSQDRVVTSVGGRRRVAVACLNSGSLKAASPASLLRGRTGEHGTCSGYGGVGWVLEEH